MSASSSHHDVVVIGSGFGALFFVEKLLKKRPRSRVLMLERGQHHSVAWQLEQQRNSSIAPQDTYQTTDAKPWNFNVGLGGGTNCWHGNTPRLHPSDFKLHSLYGVGRDWPLDYAELEPYYVEAEQRMSVAGDAAMAAVFPRSAAYPLPPHVTTSVDRTMQAAQPEWHFAMPTARASIATEDRSRCCANARCSLCPVNAKFNFENGFHRLLADPRITLMTEAEVRTLEHRSGVVTAANVRVGGREQRVPGDLFVLGANGIHSPAILLRSGMDHPTTGEGLHEQLTYGAEVRLRGLQNFDGGTITTGVNYQLYDGAFRRAHGGAVVQFENRWVYGLRQQPGRWREVAPLLVVVDDLPQDQNRVSVDSRGEVHVFHARHSDYADRGVTASFERLPALLAPLPVEDIVFKGLIASASHVQGTLRMGRDAARSVVDAGQIHHRYRNLAVVGTAVFPGCGASPPSLTVSALSLRCADLLV